VRLSSEQVDASLGLAGPTRVVAGAGTGKTAVIAERFRRLVASGVEPRRILVMTFTDRAATQMRDRIVELVPAAEAAQVGTFHALALGWLREDGVRIGIRPGFQVLAGPDRWISMRELMWELGDEALVGQERPDDLVAPLLKLQERLKQELVPVARLAAWAHRDPDPERGPMLAAAARLFRMHASYCQRERLLDFDDLIAQVVRLMEAHPEVRDHYAGRHPWVMVDEYQDTNLAQERVVELLAGPSCNVFVVGDDDQSIYRFRGASRASLERFLSCFPRAETLTLGRNRRSSGPIVLAAGSLIERNPDRVEKLLTADPAREDGVPVEVWRCATAEHEAAAIVAGIERLAASGLPLREIAILLRTHAIARPVVTALAAASIHYRQLGGRGLYAQPEVRDLIAYLRVLNDPSDLLALARLVSRPPLGLDLEQALARIREAPEQPPLRALAGWAPCAEWASLIQELTGLKARLGVDELLFELLNRTRYLELADEHPHVTANVSRFAELVDRYCERRRDHSLSLFVDYLDLVLLSGVDEDVAREVTTPGGEEDAVQVMTIHQAKGLEFEAVFVPAMVEGRLPQPHRRGDLDLPAQLAEPQVRGREDHLGEERRLCYVAMTRARGRLVLSWAERYEGSRSWRPSRFLAELGPSVVQRTEADPPVGARLASPSSATIEHSRPGDASVAPTTDDVNLSFSAISAYRECPRQHWYRYRLRLPASPAVEAQFGTVMHLALMRAGRLRGQGREVGAGLLRELHQEAWETIGLSDPRRRPALEAVGWRLLRRFHEAGGLERPPWLLEAPFTASLDGWTLRGVIDRVERTPSPPAGEGGVGAERDGTTAGWRIIDYKTGRPQPASRLRRDLQLALYAVGARSLPGIDDGEPLELEIIYLREGRSVVLEATAELLQEARQIGGEVAAAVRAGRFEARPERRRCSLCAYRIACEAAV
jgi:DNA helicase II / ATP-dependent DNA helicase PcrA